MSDGNYETPVPKDAPVMIAWDAYKASDRYSIVKKWATYPEHVDGQLWAAFYSGFFAAAVNEAPKSVEYHIAGLREAAEIIDNLKAVEEIIPAVEPTEDDLGYPAIKTRRLPSIRTAKAAILARIAELEKP